MHPGAAAKTLQSYDGSLHLIKTSRRVEQFGRLVAIASGNALDLCTTAALVQVEIVRGTERNARRP
jgi:hypothetical protein